MAVYAEEPRTLACISAVRSLAAVFFHPLLTFSYPLQLDAGDGHDKHCTGRRLSPQVFRHFFSFFLRGGPLAAPRETSFPKFQPNSRSDTGVTGPASGGPLLAQPPHLLPCLAIGGRSPCSCQWMVGPACQRRCLRQRERKEERKKERKKRRKGMACFQTC
jgi:hypothetical protein